MTGPLDRFAERLDDLERAVNSRAPQAARTTIVDGAIDQIETFNTGAFDDMNLPIYGTRVVSRIGRQDDGGNTMLVLEGPIPPAPTGYSVTAGPGTLTVNWDGTFAGGAVAPTDFYAVIVHMLELGLPGEDFPGPDTVVGSVLARDGDGITVGGLSNSSYRIALTTMTQAGKSSPAGDVLVATPGDGSSLGAVDAMQAAVDQAVQDAADALAAADGAVTTYFQPASPSPAELHEGDLWFDTDDGNKLSRWNETTAAWEVAADQRAADAITAATNAVTIANSRIQSFYQNDPPAGANTGDLWIDTNDNNRLYRFDGTWKDSRDGTIAAAASVAASAVTLAGQKGKVYRQSSAPTGASVPPPVDGDLWYDTTNFILKQRNAGAWGIPALDAGQNLKANTITSSLLATQLVLSTKIVAGPLNDSHTELDPNGLSLFQKSPEGLVQLSSRLGSPGGDDFIQVYNSTDGRVVASIDQDGGVSGATASLGTVPGDVFINGKVFEEHFAPFPLGVIAYGSRKSNGSPVVGSGNIAKWLEVQTVLSPNRMYRVTLSPTYTASSGAGARCVFALFYAAGGAAAVTTAGQLNSSRHSMPLAGEAFTSASLSFIFDTTSLVARKEYRFLTAYYGEGTAAYPIANGSLPSILSIEDMGPAQPDIGIDYGAAPPAGGTKQTYTTYWQASSSACYQGGGARRYDTDDLVHGTDPSGFNGNGSAIAIFGAGAYYSSNSSEVGKSIPTALSGATIVAADAAFKCSHAYYAEGMTVYYNSESLTSLPSSYTNSLYYGYSSFSVGQAKYVPLAKAVRTSLSLGSPPAGLQFYGRINGATQGYPPVIRYTYTR